MFLQRGPMIVNLGFLLFWKGNESQLKSAEYWRWRPKHDISLHIGVRMGQDLESDRSKIVFWQNRAIVAGKPRTYQVNFEKKLCVPHTSQEQVLHVPHWENENLFNNRQDHPHPSWLEECLHNWFWMILSCKNWWTENSGTTSDS